MTVYNVVSFVLSSYFLRRRRGQVVIYRSVDSRCEDSRVGCRTDSKGLLDRRWPVLHHRQLGVLSSIGAISFKLVLKSIIIPLWWWLHSMRIVVPDNIFRLLLKTSVMLKYSQVGADFLWNCPIIVISFLKYCIVLGMVIRF